MLNLRKARELSVRHLKFVGPGLVSSVAYIDPGNWATDLQAGASYGYKLLFIVLVAGLAAVVLQLLAVRLGAVTSTSLPHQTRQLFLRLCKKYPKYRVPLMGCLYFLYALAEIAIIGTDLAELLGSAIALNLLFPALPLFAGVLITAADVLIVLAFFNSSNGRQGMVFFEILIVSLVLAVFVIFMILLHLVKPEWKEVFFGLVPSSTLVEPGALYVGVGIIGATVMPHALFLGSSLASVDRLDMLPRPPRMPSTSRFKADSLPRLFHIPANWLPGGQRENVSTGASQEAELELRQLPERASQCEARGGNLDRIESNLAMDKDLAAGSRRASYNGGDSEESIVKQYELEMKRYEDEVKAFDRIEWVDIHVRHATIDTSMSLLGFALTINASILTLAGAVYFYGDSGASADDATLDGAFHLLQSMLGNAPAIIFALALLCAGQSASITATLAGQVVSEGFINWRTSPFLRRLITRLISVIPAAIVAAAVGMQGLNTMLVASQVLLSIVLPTVIFPLVYLCSKDDIMRVEGPIEPSAEDIVRAPSPATSDRQGSISLSQALAENAIVPALNPLEAPGHLAPAHVDVDTHGDVTPCSAEPVSRLRSLFSRGASPAQLADSSVSSRRTKCYRSPKWVTWLGYLLFLVVVVANVYVIVELGLGND